MRSGVGARSNRERTNERLPGILRRIDTRLCLLRRPENPVNHSTLFVEIGNTRIKTATLATDGGFAVTAYDRAGTFLEAAAAFDGPIVCAPVGHELSLPVVAALQGCAELRLLGAEDVAEFVGYSYDTPSTLGLDRVLNLYGLAFDAVVISCGTAVTVDAIAGGRPCWGAIMPGFATAAAGLHARIPALPLVELHDAVRLPALTTTGSVANGVLLGTARAAEAIAHDLAMTAFGCLAPHVIITGGDAEVLRRLWSWTPVPAVDETLLFKGMIKLVG